MKSRRQSYFRARTGAAAIALGLAMNTFAQAPGFPERSVTLVAPYAPGGPVDIVARALSRGLAAQWSKAVVVDNRAGASGNIGSEQVAKAAPDGHTLLLNTGALLIAPIVNDKLPFDPQRDLAPVTKIGFAPALLTVSAKSPFKSVADLVAFGKAHPGKLAFGSPGNATTLHLASELFRTLAGFEALHVPFRGSAQSVTAILGDQIHFHFDAMVAAIGHVQSGNLRALAVSTSQRVPQVPELPTMAEAGVPGYDASIWFGVFAPAATSADLIERISRDLRDQLKQPDTRKQLESLGFVIVGNSPAELRAQMNAEAKLWGEVIRKTGVKAN